MIDVGAGELQEAGAFTLDVGGVIQVAASWTVAGPNAAT
jgi:hypothetical protein